jgi:tryptophan synthase alpha chain
VIQHSSHVALKRGANLKLILSGVESLRKSIETPLILMGYLNPIIAFGTSKFLSRAARVGVDGLIIPDLPVEEAIGFGEQIEKRGMSTILLVSPTSPRERWHDIDRYSTDFVYAVTVTGVTGAGRKFDIHTDHYLRQLRRSLSKPFVAGFGVDSPEAAKRLCRSADGVVIGSALIKLIDSARNAAEARRKVTRFLTSVRKALS